MMTMKVLPLWPLVLRHQLQWHMPWDVCQLGVAYVKIGDGTYSEDRLALELISPIATSTATFHHVVEMFALLIGSGGGGRVKEIEFLF